MFHEVTNKATVVDMECYPKGDFELLNQLEN